VVGYPQHIFPHRRGHVATGIRWPTFRRPTFLLHQQRYPPGKRLGGDVTQIQGGGFEVTGGTLVILKKWKPRAVTFDLDDKRHWGHDCGLFEYRPDLRRRRCWTLRRAAGERQRSEIALIGRAQKVLDV
jgi:hypothetical protein